MKVPPSPSPPTHPKEKAMEAGCQCAHTSAFVRVSSRVSLQDNLCSLRTDDIQRADGQIHTTDVASRKEPAPKGPLCYFKIAHIQNKTTCIVILLPYTEVSYFIVVLRNGH